MNPALEVANTFWASKSLTPSMTIVWVYGSISHPSEQPSDHALVLRVVLLGLALEELDAALAQRDRDLDAFVPENQIFRKS